jgi:hypothetical protein
VVAGGEMEVCPLNYVELGRGSSGWVIDAPDINGSRISLPYQVKVAKCNNKNDGDGDFDIV